MTKTRAAILCLLLLTVPTLARGARIEELPDGERPSPLELLPEPDSAGASPFLYRPPPGSAPTFSRRESIRFVPLLADDREAGRRLVETVPMLATKALADLRLREPGEPDLRPDQPVPPPIEVVPEPGAIALFAAGLLLLLLLSRRRAAAR